MLRTLYIPLALGTALAVGSLAGLPFEPGTAIASPRVARLPSVSRSDDTSGDSQATAFAGPVFRLPRQLGDRQLVARNPGPDQAVGSPSGIPYRGVGPTMSVVADQATGLIRQAAMAARRGALYSARADLVHAMQIVAQALDAQHGTSRHTRSLEQGLRALQETADFAPSGNVGADLTHIVPSHRTPVLQRAALNDLAVPVAIQHYCAYARDQFAEAFAGEPTASLALYALARLQEPLVEPASPQRSLVEPRAMALYQAALQVDSRNALAANELGVLLARYGRLREARDVLTHCVQRERLPEAWHNLAAVHQRLGELELAELARRESVAAQRDRPGAQSQSSVTWVASEEFSRPR